jgi:hypothetical protein
MAHRPTWVIPLGLLPTGAFPLQLGGTPQQVHDNILHSFDAHAGDEPLKDDLTLLVIGRKAVRVGLTPAQELSPVGATSE